MSEAVQYGQGSAEGIICSSTRALRAALEAFTTERDQSPTEQAQEDRGAVIVCLDSRAELQTVQMRARRYSTANRHAIMCCSCLSGARLHTSATFMDAPPI